MKKNSIKKTQSNNDIYYPLPSNFSLSVPTIAIDETKNVQKQIVHQALRSAFCVQEPSEFNFGFANSQTKGPLLTEDQIELVTSLMQSLQPTDAVEASLAAQFAATYIHGMKDLGNNNKKTSLAMLEFGHRALDTLLKYRNKGSQQISVQYNINHGQVVNIKNMKKHENKKEEK